MTRLGGPSAVRSGTSVRQVGPIVFFIFALTLTALMPMIIDRMRAEKLSRHVMIGIDQAEVVARGDSDLYRRLAEAGATGVGIDEWTFRDALEREKAFVFTQDATYYVGWTIQRDDWVSERLEQRFAELAEHHESDLVLVNDPSAGGAISELPSLDGYVLWAVDPVLIRSLIDMPLGFHPDDVQQVVQAGFYVIPRIVHTGGGLPNDVSSRFAALQSAPVGPFLFVGGDVDIDSASATEYAQHIGALDGILGTIEFTRQLGLTDVITKNDFQAVRVHSISEGEMAASHMTSDRAQARMVRAVRERSVRLLYVRMLPDGSTELGSNVDYNVEYVSGLRDQLQQAGFVTVESSVTRPLHPHLFSLMVAVIATGGLSGLLVWWFFRVWLTSQSFKDAQRRGVQLGIIGAGVGSLVFWILWIIGYPIQTRQLFALLANVVFPVAAVVTVFNRAPLVSSTTVWDRLKYTGMRFGQATAITGAGAMIVVVLLNDPRFILKLDEFRGVKVAHVAPLLLVFLYWIGLRLQKRSTGLQTASLRRQKIYGKIKLKLSHVMVALGVTLFLAVYILRTGNDGLPVLRLESDIRLFLENVFFVRPRTKEFLIGHPALFIAFTMGGAKRAWESGKAVHMLLLVIGTIGQLSMINTFAHAHSPLYISIARTGTGLLIGVLIGVLSILVLEYVGLLYRRPSVTREG